MGKDRKMKTFKQLQEEIKSCWKGFEAIGFKKKNGKKVPNCVPVKEELQEQLNVPVLSPEELAKKHKKSVEYINQQLKVGQKIEKEHTKNSDDAFRIASAHIGEKPDYYVKLNKYVESVEELDEESPAWQRKEGKNPEGGLNQKGVESYRRENPGSKLQTAVTKDPSKIKKGSKDDKRRKSFCARMGGMSGPMKDEKGRPTRKALALKKWNC